MATYMSSEGIFASCGFIHLYLKGHDRNILNLENMPFGMNNKVHKFYKIPATLEHFRMRSF